MGLAGLGHHTDDATRANGQVMLVLKHFLPFDRRDGAEFGDMFVAVYLEDGGVVEGGEVGGDEMHRGGVEVGQVENAIGLAGNLRGR